MDSASSTAATACLERAETAPPLDRARVPALVLDVLRTLQAAGKQAFLAGGAVRDLARLALGQVEVPANERWPADFDVATDALPEQVLALFPRAIPTGMQHGTVTVLARGDGEEHKVEVTTFRGEGPYLDGRRPSAVTFLGEIEGDLARRDFTVNAMAWDPLAQEGSGLRDPFGGIADLRKRRLRAVGNAQERFSEDGLRPLRAVRFAGTLRLSLDRKTELAIGETLATFKQVAQERVRDELEKLLMRGRPVSRGLRLLRRTGLLQAIAPELDACVHRDSLSWRRVLRALDASERSLAVRLALFSLPLSPDRRAPLIDALRFPTRLRDRVLLLQGEAHGALAATASDGECRRAIARVGISALPELLALRKSLSVADGDDARDDAMNARFKLLLQTHPPLTLQELAIDGRQLMSSLQLPPGPAVGQLLRALLERLFDDPSLNSVEQLKRLASEIVHAQSTSNSQG